MLALRYTSLAPAQILPNTAQQPELCCVVYYTTEWSGTGCWCTKHAHTERDRGTKEGWKEGINKAHFLARGNLLFKHKGTDGHTESHHVKHFPFRVQTHSSHGNAVVLQNCKILHFPQNRRQLKHQHHITVNMEKADVFECMYVSELYFGRQNVHFKRNESIFKKHK